MTKRNKWGIDKRRTHSQYSLNSFWSRLSGQNCPNHYWWDCIWQLNMYLTTTKINTLFCIHSFVKTWEIIFQILLSEYSRRMACESNCSIRYSRSLCSSIWLSCKSFKYLAKAVCQSALLSTLSKWTRSSTLYKRIFWFSSQLMKFLKTRSSFLGSNQKKRNKWEYLFHT